MCAKWAEYQEDRTIKCFNPALQQPVFAVFLACKKSLISKIYQDSRMKTCFQYERNVSNTKHWKDPQNPPRKTTKPRMPLTSKGAACRLRPNSIYGDKKVSAGVSWVVHHDTLCFTSFLPFQTELHNRMEKMHPINPTHPGPQDYERYCK